jgi:type IV fimbrial biogenesis protein FimT
MLTHMKSRSRGFTLMELVVVLALAAVIIGIGVPSFRDFQRNNRLTVAANDVLGMVITSRAEALRRQQVISMCPSADPLAEDAVCGSGPGWIVFEDPDADCDRADAEELIAGTSIDTDVMAATNSGCLSFAGTGFKRVVAGEPSTSYMLYCDERGNTPRNPGGTDSAARGVEVPPTGRGAVMRRVDELEAWSDVDDPVVCP